MSLILTKVLHIYKLGSRGSIIISWACKKAVIRYMSPVIRKPAFCICENKDADQLCGNREADQRLCFPYTDSTFSLLPKSEISSL